ncbi:hypothetical protein J3F84DRAFT_364665 [Trichoderma pleuroticola]
MKYMWTNTHPADFFLFSIVPNLPSTSNHLHESSHPSIVLVSPPSSFRHCSAIVSMRVPENNASSPSTPHHHKRHEQEPRREKKVRSLHIGRNPNIQSILLYSQDYILQNQVRRPLAWLTSQPQSVFHVADKSTCCQLINDSSRRPINPLQPASSCFVCLITCDMQDAVYLDHSDHHPQRTSTTTNKLGKRKKKRGKHTFSYCKKGIPTSGAIGITG